MDIQSLRHNRFKGMLVSLWVKPRARADRIVDLSKDGSNTIILKVSVTVVPEDNKANEAVIRLLSKVLKLPQRCFSIATGNNNRRKVLSIAAEPTVIAPRLQKLAESLRR